MKLPISGVFLLLLLMQGCSSTLKLDPQALNGQHEIYQNGVEVVVSTKASIVALRPSSSVYSSKEQPGLVVTVFNGTGEPFPFSTQNVRILVDGQPAKVFTFDELAAELRRKQTWATVAAALGGISQSMNAANAGYTYHSGSFNASTYGTGGYNAFGYGSYSGYSYDAAAA